MVSVPMISGKRFVLYEVQGVPMFSEEHRDLKFSVETKYRYVLSTSIKDEIGLVDKEFLDHCNHRLPEKIICPNLVTFKIRNNLCEANIVLEGSIKNCSLKVTPQVAYSKII